jgi:DNA helicase HerA-like ATPase
MKMTSISLGGRFPRVRDGVAEGSIYPPITLPCSMLNRHGLISGATGTGKTVTLQVLAEELSRQGVAVFTADVKGDLSGVAGAGKPSSKIDERCKKLGFNSYSFEGNPTAFWDLYQEEGIPLRTTVSEMGPLLFSHILDLNTIQTDILHLLFRFADDEGLLLLDLKDLTSLISWVSEHRKEFSKDYGHVAPQSLGAIRRRVHVLEDAGGGYFFGEPAFVLSDLFQRDFGGRGLVHVLDATKLILEPRLYSAFLVWLLSELFEELEEYGDKECPRLVFFFDEAHLLFSQGSKQLLEKFETVVRLIRSKGVGVFFVTQNPLDVPETIRGQLGAKVLHALRAHSVKERKALKVLAETFVSNPEIDPEELLPALGVGEALVSFLDTDGVPTPVEHTLIQPPRSQIGPLENAAKKELYSRSPFSSKYAKELDRESAFEVLKKRSELLASEELAEAEKAKTSRSSRRQSVFEAFLKSVSRSIGYQIGRQIVRGVLGSIVKSSR